MAGSRSLKIEGPSEMMRKMKQEFEVCVCFTIQFKKRSEVPEPPDEVRAKFKEYSENEGTMRVEQLHKFLIESQGEEEGDAQAIIDGLRKQKHMEQGLDLLAFFAYLIADHRSRIHNGPLRKVDHPDMNAPLAHYFIYTGHNSYLTGNQLSSRSSTKAIKAALMKGVRVIELDLWPTVFGNDVKVYHGRTCTASVKLRDCLKVIRENAFQKSDYPVVITFEDHLGPSLQDKVHKMVTEIFNEGMLCTDPVKERKQSPEDLKKRVLISTKPPEYRGKIKQEDDLPKKEFDEDSTKYEDLIAIHAGKPKGPVENWLTTDQSRVRRVSLDELKLESVAQGTQIVRFTRDTLLRVYPKGIRVDSSNYNPMIGWTNGAQMVAFNMQVQEKYLWMMDGLFRAYGAHGYVKKPDVLLSAGPNGFDPSAAHTLPVKQTLKVKVYMGTGWHSDFGGTHFDCYSPPDFRVKVGICGVKADEKMKDTETVEDQWIPVWNEEFEFELRVPELALLYIEVTDDDPHCKPDFGGQTCLPVSLLKSGIRSVPLFDPKCQLYPHVRLLMAFRFRL